MSFARIIQVAAFIVVLGASCAATALSQQQVPSPSGSPTSVPSATYQLPYGKIWGHLQKLNQMADYTQSDTVYVGGSTTINAVDGSLQQPQYFRVFQAGDGTESINLAPTHGHTLTSFHFAYNPREHTSMIAVGVPTPAFLQQHHVYMNPKGPSGYHTASSSSSAEAGKTNGLFQPTQLQDWQSSYNIDTVWNDPAYLAVTEVTTSMTCNVSGWSVYGCNGSDRRWWLADGWSEYSHSRATYYPAGDHAITYTHAHYTNSFFCNFILGFFGGTTDVYYHDNEVDILSDGSQYANLSTSDSGGCASWLSYSDTVYA